MMMEGWLRTSEGADGETRLEGRPAYNTPAISLPGHFLSAETVGKAVRERGEWNGGMWRQCRQALDSCSQLSNLSHRSDEENNLE